MKHFQIQKRQIRLYNSTYREVEKLNLTKCLPQDLFNKPQFEQLNAKSFYCLNHIKYLLRGFSTPPYQYIDIGISLDKDTALKNTEFYKSLFRNNLFLFNMIYLDSTLDLDKFDNPIDTYINSFITYIDYWTMRKINFYFSKFNFETNNNFLVEDFLTEHSFKQNNEFVEYSINLDDRLQNGINLTLLKLYIRSSPNVLTISRQYQKITDYLANMSGLISQVLLVIYLITNYINGLLAENSIMNRILFIRILLYIRISSIMKILLVKLKTKISLMAQEVGIISIWQSSHILVKLRLRRCHALRIILPVLKYMLSMLKKRTFSVSI
jgi:hypothetical protein